jgi:hypothetical protein
VKGKESRGLWEICLQMEGDEFTTILGDFYDELPLLCACRKQFFILLGSYSVLVVTKDVL